MNREIALRLIDEEVCKLRKLPYEEFLNALDEVFTSTVQGSDGKTYELERQAFWDGKIGGNIRVMVSVDDGGLSSFKPLSGEFIISPGGSLLEGRG